MARIIDFPDGFASSTEPTTGGAIASFAEVFANDAAYEVVYGAGASGSFYFNSTLNKLRIHDGTSWRTNERALDGVAAIDPTVNEDSDDGYEVLSLWLNTASGALFRAVDVTVGAAVWTELAADAVLDSHINTASIHVDWAGASAGTIHASNYVDNDTVYTHPNHSGEVTSTADGAQVVAATAITNKTLKSTLAGTEKVLIDDTGLKHTTAQDIADLGAAGAVAAVAILKDVKAVAVDGGTFTGGGVWRTRDLNTVEGDGTLVTLATNQFTLVAGHYLIEANSPAFAVGQHAIQLANITDSTAVLGTAAYGSATNASQISAVIADFTTVATKTFEIQHKCVITGNTNGFGVNNAYDSSIYTQVKITKLG